MALESLFRTVKVTGIRRYSCCINLNDPYIISAVRTPIGVFQGKLSSLSAIELGAKALTAAFKASCIPKEDIREFVMGCQFLTGLGQGPAAQVAKYAGLSESTVTSCVNKLCASGMKALIVASQIIASNTEEVVAAGGTESLSNVPYLLRRKNLRIGNLCIPDVILYDGLIDMFEQLDVTHFAEMTAKEYNCTRCDQDEYGIESYRRAAAAQEMGFFSSETIPVTIKKKKGEEEEICYDEEIKRFNLEKYKNLTPDVGRDGTVTVGNSSGLNDGASMMVLASGNYVLKKSLKPLARIVAYADANLDSKHFCIAPSVSIPKALVRANLCAGQISMWEINETFALTAMVNTKLLKLDPQRVNVHGGAISLGHPFGMTGARLITHLAHVLNPGEYGCACVSHGTGGASTMIIEKM